MQPGQLCYGDPEQAVADLHARVWRRLELGVPGLGSLTWEESKAHLALYAVTSSPLLLGNDVRVGYMQQRLVDLLLNRDMLAVNQGWAGFAGDRIWSRATGKECWAKPLPGRAAGVVLFNRNGSVPTCNTVRPSDAPCDDWPDRTNISAGSQAIDLPFDWLPRAWLLDDDNRSTPLKCAVFDIFHTPQVGKRLGYFTHSFSAATPPHGVAFLRLSNCTAALR